MDTRRRVVTSINKLHDFIIEDFDLLKEKAFLAQPRLGGHKFEFWDRLKYFEKNFIKELKVDLLTIDDIDSHFGYVEGELIDIISYLYAAGVHNQVWKRWCFITSVYYFLRFKYKLIVKDKFSSLLLYDATLFTAIAGAWDFITFLVGQGKATFKWEGQVQERTFWAILGGELTHPVILETDREDLNENHFYSHWLKLYQAHQENNKEQILKAIKGIAYYWYNDFDSWDQFSFEQPSFEFTACATGSYLQHQGLLGKQEISSFTPNEYFILRAGLEDGENMSKHAEILRLLDIDLE